MNRSVCGLAWASFVVFGLAGLANNAKCEESLSKVEDKIIEDKILWSEIYLKTLLQEDEQQRMRVGKTANSDSDRPVRGRLWNVYQDDEGNFLIPYRISPQLKNNRLAMKTFTSTIKEYSSRTCLKFVARTVGLHNDYISFEFHRRCMTRTGRITGKQMVYIGGRCIGSVVSMGRMLMHTFGFGKATSMIENGDADYVDEGYRMPFNDRLNSLKTQEDLIPESDILAIKRAYGCKPPATTTAPQTTTGSPSSACGVPRIKPNILLQHKILGGQQVRPGSFPWQASINFKKSDRAFCGGSLITKWWILTAAHCFLIKSDPNFYSGYLGKHRKDIREDGDIKLYFTNLIQHSGYNLTSKQHDIALLKLNREVTLTDRISTICLPSIPHRLPDVGTRMVVTGWGDTRGTGSNMVLRQVVVPLIDFNSCKASYSLVREGMLCAGYEEGGKDACSGDSGGPLVARSNSGRFRLVGIVSWGDQCGVANKPGVYTNVADYLDWIYNKMAEA